MSRWKGHPGKWIYRAKYNFPGYWGVTAGTYYWQVHHFVARLQPDAASSTARIRQLPRHRLTRQLGRAPGSRPGVRADRHSWRMRCTASSSRSSGVVSEMRKKPSPLAP